MDPPMWAIGDGHQERVAGVDQPVLADLADQRVDRIMGVQNAFRPACGARGVEDHPHGVGVERRQARRARSPRRAATDTAVWSPGVAAHHHDLGRRGHRGGDPVQHRDVVVLPELAGTKIMRLSASSRMNAARGPAGTAGSG